MGATVFIHTNAKQLLAARVAQFAVASHLQDPSVAVEILRLEDYPELHSKEGHTYLRSGREDVWRNDDLQSFTPLRFLPPSVKSYAGRALVIDPDVFAVDDITGLLRREMNGKSILCRRITPRDGRPSYWASSVMLLDCAKLRHWDWSEMVREMFAHQRDYRDWISLDLEPQESIGALEAEWNDFDRLTERTRFLHNTSRITQPWKTGLPVDFQKDPVRGLGPLAATKRAIGRTRRVLLGHQHDRYLPHPDPRQEHLFFRLLGGAMQAGHIDEQEIEQAVEAAQIRPDAIKLLDQLKRTST